MAGNSRGLYMPNGDYVHFDAESLTTELATRQNAGFALGDMSAWFNQLPDPDPVLRKRGDDAVVLAELSADDQVTTAILSRKNRVLNSPHFTSRAGAPEGETPTPEAEMVYARLIKDLERTNMRTIVSGIMDAPFFGLIPLELIWDSQDGWWHISDIIPRPYHWFAFDHNNVPHFRGEGGCLGSDNRPLPPGKFVMVSHHATYDNPYGLRLLSRCLWPVTFKRGGLQFYAKFIERHGIPWVIGNAPPKANRAEKQVMARDLARMVQDCVAALPAGADVKFLAPVAGQDQLHEKFLARQDKAISKLLMGQTLTVEMEGRNNSQAAAEVHGDTAESLADSDKAMVADAFNEIAWLYTMVNTGAQVLAPLFAYEEPEDLIVRAELDEKLYAMGVDFTPEHFTTHYNLKETEFTIRPPQTGFPFTFSQKGSSKTAITPSRKKPLVEQAQAGFDAAIKGLLPEVLKANKNFVTLFENRLQQAASFDEVEMILADMLSPSSTPSEVERVLARAMTVAAGYGAASVQAESTEE